jgi:hypothetical protein
MNNRTYEELEDWEKAFYDLNEKLGNDVWGAKLEDDGEGNACMRVYVNKKECIKLVSQETNDEIAGYDVVFTVFSQEEHAKKLLETENDD